MGGVLVSKYLVIPFTESTSQYNVDSTDIFHINIGRDKRLVRTFFDFTLGYSNEEIINNMSAQLLNTTRVHTPLGLTSNLVDEAESFICESGNWAGMAWAVTGTGAVENAISISDQYWTALNAPKKYIISFPCCWHGTSSLAKELGGTMTPKFPSGRTMHIQGPGWTKISQRPLDEARMMQSLKLRVQQHKDEIGAILMDPSPWFGGVRPFSTNWWQSVRDLCDQNDILFIIDDVASGWGKNGTWHSHMSLGGNIQPDISSIGKALSGGYAPISATVFNDKIKQVINKNVEYAHTFQPYIGGVSAILSVRDIIERDGLLDNVDYITSRLTSIGNDLMLKNVISNFLVSGLMASFYYEKDIHSTAGLSGKVSSKHILVCAPMNADDEYLRLLARDLHDA
jgi:adenosylmethionine-8-amino-7-oxononanoate aminotransferase